MGAHLIEAGEASVIGPVSHNVGTMLAMPGDLYYGDNLDVMRNKIAPESIDLIYLDPPFNSDRTYNLIYRDSLSQERTYVDTWHWDEKSEGAYLQLTGHAPPTVRVPPELSAMMTMLKTFLYADHRDTLAYLSMMAIRLVEMKRILRKTGSLYLHCDPTASHYLKIVLDSIFGPENFRNEIVWKRTGAHNSAASFGPIHDVILFYARSSETTCHPDLTPYSAKYRSKFGKVDEKTGKTFQDVTLTGSEVRNGESGMPWRGHDPTSKNRHWAIAADVYSNYLAITGDDLHKYPFLERLDRIDAAGLLYWSKKSRGGLPRYKFFEADAEGVPGQDIWTDIPPINSQAAEATGYGTQKPVPLLERILNASSATGDLVLDPFCGCGTTVEAAEVLGRKWIGIDVAIRAVDVMKERLYAKFQRQVWTEYGEPSDMEQAGALAERDAYDFQWWAVRMLGGQPPKGEKKKGGDGGIDGEMTLQEKGSTVSRHVIISVKGGNLTPDFVRALKTTVDQAKADYGILLTMHEPTQGMRDVARECGIVPWSLASGKPEHRIRIITVAEIFAKTAKDRLPPGENLTPRSLSVPPPPEPRHGESLNLPFQTGPKKAAAKKKAKYLKPEPVEPEILKVADRW